MKQLLAALALCISFTTAFGAAAPDSKMPLPTSFTQRHILSLSSIPVDWEVVRTETPVSEETTRKITEDQIRQVTPAGHTLVFVGNYLVSNPSDHKKSTLQLLPIFQSKTDPTKHILWENVHASALFDPGTGGTLLYGCFPADSHDSHVVVVVKKNTAMTLLWPLLNECTHSKNKRSWACPDCIDFQALPTGFSSFAAPILRVPLSSLPLSRSPVKKSPLSISPAE